MDIFAKELVTYKIAKDGTRFRLSFICTNGESGSISFPMECLQGLIMTLPSMMKQALHARYRDASLRLVYPAQHVCIEWTRDPNQFIVSFTTLDGFAVSFSLTEEQIAVLAQPF
jgi:hypothetical protein